MVGVSFINPLFIIKEPDFNLRNKSRKGSVCTYNSGVLLHLLERIVLLHLLFLLPRVSYSSFILLILLQILLQRRKLAGVGDGVVLGLRLLHLI